MLRTVFGVILLLWVLVASDPTPASTGKNSQAMPQATPKATEPALADSQVEARLIGIYRLIGQSRNREALALASSLVAEFPNFQLAQLVYGDLLSAQSRPLNALGDVPTAQLNNGNAALKDLREEAARRVAALRERPTPGTIPSQFLMLSKKTRHAIAVDASRSRLYLFENNGTELKLVDDFYISLGKAGVAKNTEGDQRTPLGVYHITSTINPKSLRDFYGSGALPINYPTQLDAKRGKTGSGIWLHGTPPSQFSRPPQASDGCVVLANPDLQRIVRIVEVQQTPVIIAERLNWVEPSSIRTEGTRFEEALHAWRLAKASGELQQVLAYYSPDFNSYGKTLSQWTPTLQQELHQLKGRAPLLKDVSYLRWTDTADTMVVTFGEVAVGRRVGSTKRQYWIRENKQWKIFFEGTIG